MKLAIAIFFWLCAAGLLALGVGSEVDEERHAHPGKPVHPEGLHH